jgi:ATP-dependent Clp protease ATP-binding subunit ClpA
MSRDKDFKRLVRRRMRKTGESYSSARAHLLAAAGHPRSSRTLTGGIAMYPFDRFTERAKKVLTLAQAEAAAAGHGRIGTEHLLLGLVTEGDGLAAIALGKMGVTDSTPRLREEIQHLQGDLETENSDVVRPTPEVKRVIELAFDEAKRVGQDFVGTEHLLAGILAEGAGVGARVLAEMGVTRDRVTEEIERLRKNPEQIPDPVPIRRVQPRSAETQALLAAAQNEAAEEGTGTVMPHHLVKAMINDTATSNMLSHLGTDVAELRRRLTHPSQLTDLRDSLLDTLAKKEDAIASQDYEQAAVLRAQEKRTRGEWARLYSSWVTSLSGGDTRSGPARSPAGPPSE